MAFRDADEIPASARADVALMVRDGHLKLDPDGTLRPRQAMTRARVIGMFASLLEARGLIALQKGTARQSTNGALVVRAVRGADRSLKVSDAAYLFRAFGDGLYPVRAVTVIGGEPISYHTDARGEVDYLEVRPAPNGASSDRASSFSNWVQELSAAEVRARLARAAARIGDLLDLRVAARGASRRVTDLEIVGSKGSTHLVGGGIRSALGLRDQLFVIDRRYDGAGQLAGFVFTGRGWGHGVGMCQFGAYGLARAGLTYDQILKAYYSGIELKKVY